MNQPKITSKILLTLADSITSYIVLNNKLFNIRSITSLCQSSQWRSNLTDAALRTEVLAMTVLTDKPEVGWTDAALLVEEHVEIYTTPTPTPKGWREAKKSNWY